MKTYAEAVLYCVKMRQIACYMHIIDFLLCLHAREA